MVNRGIAKRPLFENRGDIRYFLSRLAREVRSGRIEVHAYCMLTTHFHLLLRSPVGALGEAMRRAQNAYARRFNRLRRRDGSLLRGRFFSRPVDSRAYQIALVCYIDANPVRAGIVSRAEQYAFGSASLYVRGDPPRWLERSWIEETARALAGTPAFDASAYRRAFLGVRRGSLDALCEVVERRMSARLRHDPLDDLVGSSPAEVQAWMERRTRLADNHQPGLPVCALSALGAALDDDERQNGVWLVERDGKLLRGREIGWTGLAHELGGRSWTELAALAGGSITRARRFGREHRLLMQTDGRYAARARAVASVAMCRSSIR